MSARNGKPALLVVEDNDDIRKMLGATLTHFGFEIVLASSGADALSLYRAAPDRIGAVLMDVVMPDMDGVQTLAALRQIVPDVRCCFMTGQAGRYREEDLLAAGAAHVVAKPFLLVELTTVLKRLVSGL